MVNGGIGLAFEEDSIKIPKPTWRAWDCENSARAAPDPKNQFAKVYTDRLSPSAAGPFFGVRALQKSSP
jgi:hypothetical protein